MLLIVLFAGSLLAFLLSSVAGGGAGLLLMPVLAVLLPAAQAPAALSLGTATSAASRLAALRGSVRWDVVRWFVPTALPAAMLGAWLLTRFDALYVQLILGLFLVANLPGAFARKAAAPLPIEAASRPRRLLVVGAAAGLLSGFTGAVGLLFNRFYYRLEMTKEEVVATRAANEILLHVVKLGLYAAFGLLTAQAVYAGVVVAAGAIVAALLTRGLLARLDEGLFRRIGMAAMVLAGISMTTTASSQVLARHDAGVAVSVEPHEVEMTTRWHGSALSVELDAVDGLVLERRMDVARLSPALRARIAGVVGGGRLLSVEKSLRLAGRDWEVEFERAGRIWEVNIPRHDGEA